MDDAIRGPRVLSLGEALHKAMDLPVGSVAREIELNNCWYAATFGIVE
jgi:hypothetical protein